MDYGTLLTVTARNEQQTSNKPCYQTKFQPLKKESKQTRNLSDNIKKFLARKKEEERKKAEEEKRRKENLLTLRDQKTQNRIIKHLKVCKAANKSVLFEGFHTENTTVTLTGPSQCDEDDYGYVSQEASAFHNKLIDKYSSLPSGKPLVTNDSKTTVKNIASTKDRVRQVLKQQELEEYLSCGRKRKRIDEEKESERDRERESGRDEKQPPKQKPLPVSQFNYHQLLKLAEKINVSKSVEKRNVLTNRSVEKSRPVVRKNGSSSNHVKSSLEKNIIVEKHRKLEEEKKADVKSRQFPPADVRPRQYIPPDVRTAKPKSSKLKVNKRRIYDDSDEEHDSELDDFIVDEAGDESENYSKYISEIFGYDTNKYREFDDEDDAAMESNFAQQLKEESISTKIGKMEDLEDMRQEALEEKRKALMKRKKM